MSTSARLDVNIGEMQRKLDDHANKFLASAVRAVKRFEDIELKEMKKRTPVETGELEASGHAAEPVLSSWGNQFGRGTVIKGVIAFTAPHAVYVHEDLEAHHENGQAKYMSSVLDESGPHFLERVADDIKKDLGL